MNKPETPDTTADKPLVDWLNAFKAKGQWANRVVFPAVAYDDLPTDAQRNLVDIAVAISPIRNGRVIETMGEYRRKVDDLATHIDDLEGRKEEILQEAVKKSINLTDARLSFPNKLRAAIDKDEPNRGLA